MSFFSGKVIEVKELKKFFHSGLFHRECIRAVDGVSFEIARGESLGLVGESGSGKSTLGRCLLRLIEPSAGEVLFQGIDVLAANGDLKNLRKRMQIIYQDTDGCLNPRMKAKNILLEPLRVHRLLKGNEKETALELMELVNLPADLLERYPNELSGGQRQRIGIARAISINPEFIVADEAIASLDLLGQVQIMDLINRLKSKGQTSFLIISHNLRFIRRTTERLAVMYYGRLVEIGKTEEIFNQPVHPYTRILLPFRPKPHVLAGQKKDWLEKDGSFPPSLVAGCLFHPRCPRARAVCQHEVPAGKDVSDGHRVWCHF